MEELFMLVVVVLGIKYYLTMAPTYIKKYLKKKKLYAEDIIKFGGITPERYYELNPEERPTRYRKRRR